MHLFFSNPTVPNAPTLEASTATTDITLKTSVTLTCATVGGTEFEFQKGTAGSRQTIQTFSSVATYTIASFEFSDADAYICKAKNVAVAAQADSDELVTTLASKSMFNSDNTELLISPVFNLVACLSRQFETGLPMAQWGR